MLTDPEIADNAADEASDKAPDPRPVEYSADFLADVMGQSAYAGQRVQAGPVLKMMYNTAVSVALRHSGYRSVLLGIDRIDLANRICHMDLVRLEGKVIEVGRSSMVIEVACFAKAPGEREITQTHVGFVKMVAVDDRGNPLRPIPGLDYNSPMGAEAKALAAHRRAQLAERQQALEWIEAKEEFKVSEVIESEPTVRYEYLRPRDTIVNVKSQIISQEVHRDGRVPGGDFLVWLDRIATYTASQFTRNAHVITLALNDILFKRPLHATDRIELTSRVILVRAHTLEVSIEVTVHTLEGDRYALDSVDFLIINFHPSGAKKKITTGLLLDDADQESLKRYIRARTRYSFWKSNPESHLTQTPS